MTTQTLLLPNQETVELTWNAFYTKTTVSQNKQTLHTFTSRSDLKTGARITLQNKETIYIRLCHDELEAWHNNIDLVSGLPSGSFKPPYKLTKGEVGMHIGLTILEMIISGI
jgi:hypothetical protein